MGISQTISKQQHIVDKVAAAISNN